MAPNVVATMAIADACGSEAAFLGGNLKGEVGIVVECLSLSNGEPGLVVQLGDGKKLKVVCSVNDVELQPELPGYTLVPLLGGFDEEGDTLYEYTLNHQKMTAKEKYVKISNCEEQQPEELEPIPAGGFSDFPAIEKLTSTTTDQQELISLRCMLRASVSSNEKHDVREEEETAPSHSEFRGAFQLDPDGLQQAIDLILTPENLQAVSQVRDGPVAAVVSASLLVLGRNELFDGSADSISAKSFKVTRDIKLKKIVLDGVGRLTDDLSADVIWDTNPAASIMLLWTRYCVQQSVLIRSPKGSWVSPSEDDNIIAKPQPTQVEPSNQQAWEPHIPIDITQGLSAISGLWKTLKDPTIAKIDDGKARFKVTPSSYGSEWPVTLQNGIFTLLGCNLNLKTSSTRVLRWEDGDVWEKINNTEDENSYPETQFGIHSSYGTRKVHTPEPPDLLPRRCSIVRPFSAPAKERSDRYVIPACEFKWRFGEYHNSQEVADVESLQDDNLRASFNQLDTSKVGHITRQVFDDYFDTLEHIGVRSSRYVDRILSQVKSKHRPGLISFDEYAMVMLRMASR